MDQRFSDFLYFRGNIKNGIFKNLFNKYIMKIALTNSDKFTTVDTDFYDELNQYIWHINQDGEVENQFGILMPLYVMYLANKLPKYMMIKMKRQINKNKPTIRTTVSLPVVNLRSDEIKQAQR